ncbi:hypothetical protein D9V28_07875 [Mycetocola zhadangensis]|uniref:Uncharacterized protein n=1 Tax=Mycetocola zhadangensis TaxID=1164595 RepID=A0A3L7J110_9MICO|nr:hypothetical protein D9V28_07875 [Mycetocola zhadangensis]
MPLIVGLVALIGFGWVWIATETSDAPASTVSWFISESALALAILVPAVCLYFVVRAMHARRVEARQVTGPASNGIQQGSELLWSLSNGLLPQATTSPDIQTDATELVFLSETAVVARHRQPTPTTRTLTASARALASSSEAGPDTQRSPRTDGAWSSIDDVSLAVTDRRILLRGSGGLIDVPYADITAVHLVPGAVVLRVNDQAPLLVACAHAESVAVLAVWGSAGESALKRHPDFAAFRS